MSTAIDGVSPGFRVVDLSIPVSDGMDAFPGEPTARFRPFSTHDDSGIEMWHVDLFSQLGTHVDAPSHFIPGAPASERMPLAAMIGPVTVVDIKFDIPHGSFITASHLEPHAERIAQATRVILRTGWDRHVGTPAYWSGFAELTPDAAEYLMELNVRFVGIDTPTPSFEHLHEVHTVLLRAGCVLAECLVNLGELSLDSFLICLPLPLVGLDGAPARVVALEPAHH